MIQQIIKIYLMGLFTVSAQAAEVNDFDLSTMDTGYILESVEQLPEGMVETDNRNQYKGPPPQVDGIPFSEEMLNEGTWISTFDVVIVINKAASGSSKQTLKMYRKGRDNFKTSVSTGREVWEKARTFPWQHRPKYGYFSSTNTGYFTPIWIDVAHRSKLWGGTLMPYSIFFDGGIAIHQAPKGTEGALGWRASGGCVRVSSSAAPKIFEAVKATARKQIPAFTQSGEPIMNEDGTPKMREGYSTLIIVENRKD